MLNGLADPHLLETYHDERAPVATKVIEMSANMFATGFANDLAHRILRKTITTFASFILRFVTIPAGRVSMVKLHLLLTACVNKTTRIRLDNFLLFFFLCPI